MFLKFKHGQIIIYKQNFSYTLSMIDFCFSWESLSRVNSERKSRHWWWGMCSNIALCIWECFQMWSGEGRTHHIFYQGGNLWMGRGRVFKEGRGVGTYYTHGLEKNCNSLQWKNIVISLWTLNFSLAFKDLYKQFWKKTGFSNVTLRVKQSQSCMKIQVGVWRCYRLGSASIVEPWWGFRGESLRNSFLCP